MQDSQHQQTLLKKSIMDQDTILPTPQMADGTKFNMKKFIEDIDNVKKEQEK